jgi:hypothetical protein
MFFSQSTEKGVPPFQAGWARAKEEVVIRFGEFFTVRGGTSWGVFGVIAVCFDADWEVVMRVIWYKAVVDGFGAGGGKGRPRDGRVRLVVPFVLRF